MPKGPRRHLPLPSSATGETRKDPESRREQGRPGEKRRGRRRTRRKETGEASKGRKRQKMTGLR